MFSAQASLASGRRNKIDMELQFDAPQKLHYYMHRFFETLLVIRKVMPRSIAGWANYLSANLNRFWTNEFSQVPVY